MAGGSSARLVVWLLASLAATACGRPATDRSDDRTRAANPSPQAPGPGIEPISGSGGAVARSPVSRVLFADALQAGWSDPEVDFCGTSHGEGGLVVAQRGAGRCILPLDRAGVFTGPVRIEVTATLRKGMRVLANYGLLFGSAADRSERYMFTVTEGGWYRVDHYNGSAWAAVVEPVREPVITTGAGAVNRLAVELDGRVFRAFVNGGHVTTFELPTAPAGGVGLTAGGTIGGDPTEAVFSDLRVSALRQDATASQRTAPAGGRDTTAASGRDTAASGCARVIGDWQWYTAAIPGILRFAADRQVTARPSAAAAPVLAGRWTCDEATGAYVITWQNSVVERLQLSDDGRTMSGTNNLGMPVRGTPLGR
jgi:hypothetical protein